jgi:uncharacterized protein YndB with AHSA1/START domain
MYFPDSFQVSLPSDRDIQVTRDFDASRRLVFDAFTKPELVRRWLLGPPGWAMPICEIDLRVGGGYRYAWRSEIDGVQMTVRGVYREVTLPERLVATETFDDAWYPGKALGTTVFVETRGVTTAKITLRYESKEARDTARRSGMEYGMAAGYSRLETLLPTLTGAQQ